jgi:hypothetical protein
MTHHSPASSSYNKEVTNNLKKMKQEQQEIIHRLNILGTKHEVGYTYILNRNLIDRRRST